jgi:hypothetical protein
MSESFEDLELKMFAYVVHEAFHEYQNEVFGDIEWAREQVYPIEDVENAALAYLEMALLVDAVEAAWADDAELASEATAQFVAVRSHRWARTDSFIATNRIYPVASAQGFLLDYFDVDWQPEAERSTRDFTYARLLGERLELTEEDHAALIEAAKARHGYPDLLAAAGRSIESHLAAYREALAVFEQQRGSRIEIAFDTNGLYRSRSTSARRLVVDRGVHELCDRYDVYTLERDETFFELHGVGLLEVNDYDGYRKTVVFYAPSVETVTVDGDAIAAPASATPVPNERDAEVRRFTRRVRARSQGRGHDRGGCEWSSRGSHGEVAPAPNRGGPQHEAVPAWQRAVARGTARRGRASSVQVVGAQSGDAAVHVYGAERVFGLPR